LKSLIELPDCLVLADTLVALESDQRAAEPPRQHLRPLGLAAPRLAFEEDGLLERRREDACAVDPDVVFIEADFAEAAAAERVVAAAVAARGPLDILIANHARSTVNSLDDVTAAELDLSFAANTRGSILLAQAFAAQHDGTRAGQIVMMTSGQGGGAMPGELAYAVSKGAIHQTTRTLAAHLMHRGITVNTINPGPTRTGWADAATHGLFALGPLCQGSLWEITAVPEIVSQCDAAAQSIAALQESAGHEAALSS